MKGPGSFSDKKMRLFVILTGIFIANALIAEVIGAKIFSLEALLGIAPLGFPFLFGGTLDLNLSVGVLIWPLVFVLSDIINEYFGRQGVRRVSFFTAGLIAYAFFVIFFATKMPAAAFWIENNAVDAQGNAFNIDIAYTKILGQGMGIIIGSLTAFLVGQLVDAYTFHYLRRLTQHKKLWLRATGSTVVSQLIDSFLVLFIAFYLIGNWTFEQVIAVAIIQYIYKIILAILLTPVIYVAHHWIDRYLGKEGSAELMEEAKTL
jgi:uncharacterized integral membrane protein (TIGR00697 family)